VILKVLHLVAATILMERALELLRMQCANAQSEYYQCAGAHTGSSVFQSLCLKFIHSNILDMSKLKKCLILQPNILEMPLSTPLYQMRKGNKSRTRMSG